MAVCETRDRAEFYLTVTLPDYIRRGYMSDKTLTADDFHIVEKRNDHLAT